MSEPDVSRRGFLGGSAAAAGALAATPVLAKGAPVSPTPLPAPGAPGTSVLLEVNGMPYPLTLDPRVSLLDALRDHLHLTGTKKGCDRGACGACTVHVDGRRVNACLTLALRCAGKKITTIEGLAGAEELHPMQEAFVAEDGMQCGYCTPGQIMSAVALLSEGRALSDTSIREWMSGNICRCGAYPNILAAIHRAAKEA